VVSNVSDFLTRVEEAARLVDRAAVERIVARLAEVRDARGRLFMVGVGGSAANASHAVNDFRKLCGIETYTPADNVSELTARTNDEGWETTFEAWLRTSNLCERDAVFVLSVGGGDAERGVSVNLVRAVDLARERGAAVLGIVGRDGGHTARVGDAVVIVPTVDPRLVTPIAESFQSVILHGIVSHALLARGEAKWEGLVAAAESPL
jgi:D-sedoheptulose 7-phosphate isomerase